MRCLKKIKIEPEQSIESSCKFGYIYICYKDRAIVIVN